MLRTTLLITACSVLIPTASFANTDEATVADNRFYISPSIYALNPDRDRVDEDVVVGYSFAAGKGFSEHFSGEVEFWREKATLRSKGLAINLLYTIQASEKFSFSGIAGIGLRQSDAPHPVTSVEERNRDPYIDLGLGLNHQLNPHGVQTSLKLFHRYQQYGFSNQQEDEVSEWLAKFAVKIPFGDNPRNTFDYEHSADSDNDGVISKFDQCPNTPPGVAVDAHGCRLDRTATHSPRVSTCKHAVVPGTECLPLASETIVFSDRRAAVREDSAEALDRVSLLLIMHREFQIQIHGYANDSDDEDFNSDLAARRANSVRTALIHLGASKGRIHIVPGNAAEDHGQLLREEERLVLIEFIK